MKRRDFLRVASGATAGSAVVAGSSAARQPSQREAEVDGPLAALQESNNSTNTSGNQSEGGAPAGGTSKTVEVGPGGNNVFVPGTDDPLYAAPGTTVTFDWKSDGHNIVVEGQPSDASWSGYESLEDEGFSYQHTFETLGEYDYFCDPHKAVGMTGKIIVNESGSAPASESAELDPEEMGVPFLAHYVGIATVLMMVISSVFAFFTLKYGESRHASAPNKE